MKEYIVFLLGADNFKVSQKIRQIALNFGMDNLFDDCCYIADKFLQYDKRNEDYMSEYESLVMFLTEYEKEINDFLDNGEAFEIKGGE